jgi:hypothetical protein
MMKKKKSGPIYFSVVRYPDSSDIFGPESDISGVCRAYPPIHQIYLVPPDLTYLN